MILNMLCLKIVFEINVCKLQKENEFVQPSFIFTTTLTLTPRFSSIKSHRSSENEKKRKKIRKLLNRRKFPLLFSKLKERSKHVWNGADIIEVRTVFYAEWLEKHDDG